MKTMTPKLLAPMGLAFLLGGGLGPVVSKPQAVLAPTQSPTPEQLQAWEELKLDVQRELCRFHGEVGVIIKDLRSGLTITKNADEPFPSASLIKVPIMAAVFQAIEEGKFSLQSGLILTRAQKRGGSGILKRLPAGTPFTVEELLTHMIAESDNTATEMLVDALGLDHLQAAFQRLGLRRTTLHPDGLRLTSRRVAQENWTTPVEMADLLERIYEGRLVSPRASAHMLGVLKLARSRDRLPRHLPGGWAIAHKTGLLRRACHDVGIVFTPVGDVLVCVLTADDPSYRRAKRLIAHLGRLTYDHYQGVRRESSVVSAQTAPNPRLHS